MPTRKHPLHHVIDADRWDAEPPLGRLVLVSHAALLDVGFVPCRGSGRSASRRRLPEQVGVAASALSLRYTFPDLLRRRRAAAGAEKAVLRLCAHGDDHVVFYGYLTGDGNRPSTHWACIDVPFVAPVLSGDLDATARALANDALGVRLWKALASGLARRLVVDICRKNSTQLPPRFISLPDDLQVKILSRLSDKDLAKVECTCRELRDLVTDRKLFKDKYMASWWSRWWSRCWSRFSGYSEPDSSSWVSWLYPCLELRLRRWDCELGHRRRLRFIGFGDFVGWLSILLRLQDFRRRRQDPTKHLTEHALQRSKVPAGGGGGKRPVKAARGEKRRCGKGAVHAPSSRHTWMHR